MKPFYLLGFCRQSCLFSFSGIRRRHLWAVWECPGPNNPKYHPAYWLPYLEGNFVNEAQLWQAIYFQAVPAEQQGICHDHLQMTYSHIERSQPGILLLANSSIRGLPRRRKWVPSMPWGINHFVGGLLIYLDRASTRMLSSPATWETVTRISLDFVCPQEKVSRLADKCVSPNFPRVLWDNGCAKKVSSILIFHL